MQKNIKKMLSLMKKLSWERLQKRLVLRSMEALQELEQTLQPVSTAHNSLLNAESSAPTDKGTTNSSNTQ